MSISLPASKPLSLRTELLRTPRSSDSKEPPSLRFTELSMPVSFLSPKQSNAANPSHFLNQPGTFLDFAATASKLWTPARHLVFLADYLEALKRRDIRKLMIEMPPRHAKSTTVDELFIPYWLLISPDERCVLASYEANFARTWGRKARLVVREIGPSYYGLDVKRDTDAAFDWEIEGHRGGMFTTGIGGPITGRGFNLGVIDDPVKNQEEAQSEVIQERNYDWYRSVWSTRREPDAVEVLIQTRWHEADLAGRLLDEEPHEWVRVTLPALAEEGDLLGREMDEPLWPERYDFEALMDIRYGKQDPGGQRRGGIGSYFWSALYQQRPTPLEGGMFRRDWWKRYAVLPAAATRGYGFLDTIQVDKPTSDFYALSTWRTDGAKYYVTDCRRLRGTWPEMRQVIADWYAKENVPLVVEETPAGTPQIQSLEEMSRLQYQGKRTGPPIIRFKIEGKSKVARAMVYAPYVEAGLVYLPNQAAWVSDWVEEHAAFPNGAHDDMVDTGSMAMIRFELDRPTDFSAFPSSYKPEPRVVGLRR